MAIKGQVTNLGEQENKALQEAIQIVKDSKTDISRAQALQQLQDKLSRLEQLLAVVQV